MKMNKILNLVLVMLLCQYASAAVWWYGDYSDNWGHADNWAGSGTGTVPTSADSVMSTPLDAYAAGMLHMPKVYAGNSFDVSRLDHGKQYGNGLDITLTVQGTLRCMGASTGTYVRAVAGYTSTMAVDGGSLYANYHLKMGDLGEGNAVINITNNGLVTVRSGRILYMGGTGAGDNIVNVMDGTLQIDGLSFGSGTGANQIKIGLDGQVKFYGDKTGSLDGWFNANRIIAAFGATGLESSYDEGANVTTVWAIPEPATIAMLAVGAVGMIRKKRK